MSVDTTVRWYDNYIEKLEKSLDDYNDSLEKYNSDEEEAVSGYRDILHVSRLAGIDMSGITSSSAREQYMQNTLGDSQKKLKSSKTKISTLLGDFKKKIQELYDSDDIDGVLFLYEKLDFLVEKTKGLSTIAKNTKTIWEDKVNSDAKILKHTDNRSALDAKIKCNETKNEKKRLTEKYKEVKCKYESYIDDYEGILKGKMEQLKNKINVCNLELDDLREKYNDHIDGEIFLNRQLYEVKDKEEIIQKLNLKQEEKAKLYKEIQVKENEKKQLRADAKNIINNLDDEIAQAKLEMMKCEAQIDDCDIKIKGYNRIINKTA